MASSSDIMWRRDCYRVQPPVVAAQAQAASEVASSYQRPQRNQPPTHHVHQPQSLNIPIVVNSTTYEAHKRPKVKRRVASPTSVSAKVLNKLKSNKSNKENAAAASSAALSSSSKVRSSSDRLDDLIVDRNKYWLEQQGVNGGDHHLVVLDDDGHEYGYKRKVERKTTKNTEKRVRRQIVLADGRVYTDHAPDEVVVDRVEDHEVREQEDDGGGPHHRQQYNLREEEGRRRLGYQNEEEEEDFRGYGKTAAGRLSRRDRSDPDLLDDRFTRTVHSHERRENETRTEASQHLGRLSRRALDRALRENRPLSEAIELSRRDGGGGEEDDEVALRRRQLKRLEREERQHRRASNVYDGYSSFQHQHPEPDYTSPPRRPQRSKSSHSQHRTAKRRQERHQQAGGSRDALRYDAYAYDDYHPDEQLQTRTAPRASHHRVVDEYAQQQQQQQQRRYRDGNYTDNYADPQYLFATQRRRQSREPALPDPRPLSSSRHDQAYSSSQDRQHRQQERLHSSQHALAHHHSHRDAATFAPRETFPLVDQEPRVVYQKSKSKKVIDTEDVHEISRLGADGKVRTETHKTHQHEVVKDDEEPDSGPSVVYEDPGAVRETRRYEHSKRDDFTDFFRVNHKGRQLEFLSHGPHATTEERAYDNEHPPPPPAVAPPPLPDQQQQQRLRAQQQQQPRGVRWEEISDRIRENREMMRRRIAAADELERKDALTKEPLNVHKEEKVRRVETEDWLERHFGSDWSLTSTSMSSAANSHRRLLQHRFPSSGLPSQQHQQQHHARTSRGEAAGGGREVRRSMSFNAIPQTAVAPHQQQQRVGGGYQVVVSNANEPPLTTTTTTTKMKKKKKVKTTTTHFDPVTGEEQTVFSTVTRSHYPDRKFEERFEERFQPGQRKSHSALDLTSEQAARGEHFTFEVIAPPPPEFNNDPSDPHPDERHRTIKRPVVDSRLNPDQILKQRIRDKVDHRHLSPQHFAEDDRRSVRSSSTHREEHYSSTTRRTAHRQNHQHQHATLERSRSDEPRRVHQRNSSSSHANAAAESSSAERRVPIVEERFGADSTTSSEKRRVKMRRSESARRLEDRDGPPGNYYFNVRDVTVGRTPRYITEFRKEKLFPASSENNLLFSARLLEERASSGRASNSGHAHRHHQQQQQAPLPQRRVESTPPPTQHQRGRFAENVRRVDDYVDDDRHFYYDTPRNYSGFRSLERSDGFVRHSNNLFRSHESPGRLSTHSEKSSGESSFSRAERRRLNLATKRARSHSFAAKFEDRSSFPAKNGDEFVYDRESRKFVPQDSGGELRHGHSDLRLDRGFHYPPLTFHKEIVHHQHMLKPQHFKTIIFLNGTG